MKKALLLALSIFAVFNVIAQEAILKEGGKRINGTASGQVLKWNGTAWVPADDNVGTVSQPTDQVVYGTGSGISSDTSLKYTARTLKFSDVAGTTAPKILMNYKDATSAFTAFELQPYNQTNFPYNTKFSLYAGNFPLANGPSEPGNHVWRMGYNIGRPSSRLSSLEMAYESLFKQQMLNGDLTYNFEWHIEQMDTLSVVHRPITIRGAHNGTVGDVGFQSDGFYLAKYVNADHYLDYNRFYKNWFWNDTVTNIYNYPQVGRAFMRFKSADNSRYYDMFASDAQNRLVINPEANNLLLKSREASFETLGTITTEDGNAVQIGSSTKPSKAHVFGTTSDLLQLTRGSNSWTTYVNSDNIVWSRPSGDAYIQAYAGDQSVLRFGNNKTAIGYGSLQSRFSINQLANTAEGGIGLYNTTGQASYIQTNATGGLNIDLPANADRVVVTTTGTGFNGVSTPLAAVDMFGDINIHSSAGAALFLGDEAFQNPSFYNRAPGLKAIFNATQGVASDLGLYAYNGNRLLVATASENGNFAIGNTAPSEKLHVTGNIRVTGSIKDSNNEAGTSGQFLKTTGTATDWANIAPSDLSQSGATSGQVIKWNGSAWAPANDAGTTYTAGTGIDVTGTVITNTGDLSNTNELQTFSNSSTSTTHTTQLSNTGGSTQFVEGVGIGLATTGTVLDGIVTITNTSPEATNVGAFQTTGTANGLSLSGSDIRLHSASLTTPGAVDLTSGQSLGSGQKVLTENLNGETQPLVIRNTSAAGADAGPGLDFQGGASNAVLMRVQSNLVGATSANGAQTYLLNRNASNGLSTVATMYPFATMEATSYFAKKRFDIAANYNASSSYNNRYGHYVMTAAAITLTLPIGTTVVDGTEVTVSNVTTSGADGTVNTGAAYSEFLFDYDLDAGTVGNQFTAVSLAVPTGKTYMLTHVTVSGTSYWKVSLLSSVAASSYTIGSYNTSGTANAASITGTAISIHSASGTTPGAVDLTDNQILGDNTKIFQKSSNAAITTPVVLRNPTADSDDDGVRLTMQNGASNTETFRIDNYVVGGTISGGVQTDFYNRSASNTMLNPLTFSSTNVAVIQGYQGGSVQTVGTSFDASASLANRKANYQFETAGGSLTLPITNVAEGTIVYLNNVLTSGADGTVNTGAAYTEFAFDSDQDAGTGGNQFYTATLAVPAMRAITLKAMGIEGQLRWKVISSSTSGGGGGAGSSTTTLDDAYNNFGATASKINVDAAQSQTGGLEFEHSGANDFTVDLQGTGDFNVQDAGTPVFRVFDNGRASFGNIAPNTSQRLVVAEDGASSVGTPIRADNGATVVDNGGTQIALAYNGFDRLNLKAYNPSGSYLNAASIETTSGANITFTDDIRETRFNAAIAREITTVTATSHQCDGRTSFIRVPSSATTTTITLPEIVSGAAGSNQVNVGYELYFSINRSVAVTINRAGTSDVFLIDSQSNSSLPTFIQTTGNLIFGKKLIASGLDEWTVVQ